MVSKKYLPASILKDFTVPEQAAVGRKNWIRKDEVTRILDAATGDPVLKFALLCGFDAGLRRDEISEARVGWFDLETEMVDVCNNGLIALLVGLSFYSAHARLADAAAGVISTTEIPSDPLPFCRVSLKKP